MLKNLQFKFAKTLARLQKIAAHALQQYVNAKTI